MMTTGQHCRDGFYDGFYAGNRAPWARVIRRRVRIRTAGVLSPYGGGQGRLRLTGVLRIRLLLYTWGGVYTMLSPRCT